MKTKHIKKFVHPIRKEFSKKKMNLNHNNGDDFLKSQWQETTASNLYLIYRWIIAIFFAIIVGFTANEFWHNGKYFIFLTHWGLNLCLFTNVYGAVIVTLWHFVPSYSNKVQTYDTESPLDTDSESIQSTTWNLRIYWILHMTTLNVALVITFIYWAFLFPLKTEPSDAVDLTLNICEHLLNSVFMIIDIMIVAHPIRILHGIFPFLFGTLYMVFSGIYYAAGGTDPKGNHYIYPILDWTKPALLVGTIFGCILLFLIFSFVTFSLYKLRIVMYRKINKSTSYSI